MACSCLCRSWQRLPSATRSPVSCSISALCSSLPVVCSLRHLRHRAFHAYHPQRVGISKLSRITARLLPAGAHRYHYFLKKCLIILNTPNLIDAVFSPFSQVCAYLFEAVSRPVVGLSFARQCGLQLFHLPMPQPPHRTTNKTLIFRLRPHSRSFVSITPCTVCYIVCATKLRDLLVKVIVRC